MWHRVVPSGGLRGRPEPPGRTRFLRFLFLNLPLACLGLSERTTASKEDGDFDWRDPEPAFLHETALNKYGPKPVQFYAVHDASASVQSGYSQPRIPAEDAEYVDGDRPDDRRKNGQVVNEGGFPIKNSVAETRKSPHHDHVAISTKMGRVTTPRGDSSSSMATVLADDVVLTTDKAASLTAALTNTGVFGDGDAGDGIIADSTVSHAQASTSGTATLKLLTANDQDQRGSTDIDTLRAQHAQLQEDDVTNAQNLARVRKSAAERTAQARLLDSMTKVRNIAGRVRERATAVLNRYGVGLNATATASTGGSFDSIFDNYFDNWDQANSYPTYKWPQTSPQTAGTVVVAQVSISMNATCKDVLDAVKTAVARDYGTVLADHVMRGAGCSAAGATEIERSAKVGMQLSSGQDANTVAKNPSFVQAMKQSFASTMGVALSKVSNVLITVVTSSAATLFLEGNLVQTSDGKSERTTTTTVQFLVKATVSVDTAAEAAAAIAAWPVESTPATLASHVTAQVTASSALTAVVISVTSAVSVPAQSIGVIEEPLSGTALPAPATTTTTTTSSTTFDYPFHWRVGLRQREGRASTAKTCVVALL
ncbi:unnamed protein product [Amoebophrya sp. A25]|nr:unnamed protein product [Amoebophrya sp. A25]|eukprot:GSA25T00018853001.1